MSLITKFMLVSGLGMSAALSICAPLLIRQEQRLAEQAVLERMRGVLSIGEACPEAARQTPAALFDQFQKCMPDHAFQVVSPPSAGALESEVLDKFQADTELAELSGCSGTESGTRFYVARPIKREGEVQGALLVSVPADAVRGRFTAITQRVLLLGGGSALVLLGVFFAFFYRLVHGRLLSAAAIMEQVNGNPQATARIAEDGRDEIGALAASFNRMADSARDAHLLLENRVSERTLELAKTIRFMHQEVQERKAVEKQLKERVALTELEAELSVNLTRNAPFQEVLRLSMESLVRHLDAALARVWTLQVEEDVLVLQASAGLSTRLNGSHGRVRVGEPSKIGKIAQERTAYVSTALNSDPLAEDPRWVRHHELVSFAGYPLIVKDQLVGVLALFLRRPLDALLLKVLASVANALALTIERKSADEEVQKAQFETEHRLAIISSIMIGVDENDRVCRWNQTAAKTFGIAPQDILGQPFSDCPIPWCERELHERIRKCLSSPLPKRLENVRFKNKKGEVRFLSLTVVPSQKTSRFGGGFLLLGTDITEHRLLEDQLRQANKLEAIGQLAAGIAHEINTPIQYVGDNTNFLRDSFRDLRQVTNAYDRLLAAAKNGGASAEVVAEVDAAVAQADLTYLNEEIPRAIEQTLVGVQHVAKIVRAMKEFSHPGSEDKTPVDINKAIENTITVCRNEWKYVAEVQTDFDPLLPTVPCLPNEFNQVMLNLIVNAAQAIAEMKAATKGSIVISTRLSRQHVEVRVRDTGGGIPETIHTKVFEPFFTTKAVGKGTGQGLAIAHAVIVKKHGGSITFETEQGRGTTFIVRLPLDAATESGQDGENQEAVRR